MKIHRKYAVIFLLFFYFVFQAGIGSSLADSMSASMELPSSPNPVGSGARALGMGGAFVAVADDATAASWNPGGLIQLEHPEISIAGSAFHRMEDNAFGTNPEADGEESVSDMRLNYLSAAYPFKMLERDMVVSLNYQHLYDFKRSWDYTIKDRERAETVRHTHDSNGSLSAVGIAWCGQINRYLSFGFTLNFWEDFLYENEWEDRWTTRGTKTGGGDVLHESDTVEKYKFSGMNANFGILWEVWRGEREITVGAVLKTPFKADLDHNHSFYSAWGNESVRHPNEKYDATLDMPMSYGIGVACRFSDKLSASMDIYRTEWGDFIYTDSFGNEYYPIARKSTADSEGHDPTHQVRIGVEYMFIRARYDITLLGGIFYDPAPSEGSPDDIFGFSMGTGIGTKRIGFDIAYQYRYGNDVGEVMLERREFSQDIREHTVYSSIIVYF